MTNEAIRSTSATVPDLSFAAGKSHALLSPLYLRLSLLVGLLALEWLPISVWVSTGRGGQSLARGLVVFLFLFLAFGYRKLRIVVPEVSRQLAGKALSWRFLAPHAGAMAVFIILSVLPAHNDALPPALLQTLWLLAGFLGISSAAFTFLPPRLWWILVRSTGYLWAFAAPAALVAWRFVVPLWSVWDSALWQPAIGSTFQLTRFLLSPLLADLIVNRATLEMGTPRFTVIVGGACSGLEGAGLMLVFTCGWLWFFRRECRFPQAFLLVPAGITVMWLLNGVRLAALILIGNAGFPAIAMGGFHSQAGWISFNLVALGVSMAAGRVPWWRNGPVLAASASSENPTAAYLVPFLAILAAAMLSRAVSGGFEWFYALRFFAAAAALWWFRRQYSQLDWHVSWFGPAVGVVVFILWMLLDPERGLHRDTTMPNALVASPAFLRISWLALRTLAAVLSVPIAEELAFRGFLIRRFISAEFEEISLRRFTWVGLFVSAFAFGALHGDRWVAGVLAGLLYAMAMLRRGKIMDAIAGHATTNALIALEVLSRNRWNLW